MKIICDLCFDNLNPFDTDDPLLEARMNQHNAKHHRRGSPSTRDNHMTNNSTIQGDNVWVTL